MNRAVFLDRDGVINRKAAEGEYILSWADIEILSGVAEGISLLRSAGFQIILVTNQRCVAKGLISTAELEALHDRLRHELAEQGSIIDAIYYCPHDTDQLCSCRKPKPGMVLQAGKDHGIALELSWLVGDSESDIEAGLQAGCMTARIVDSGDVHTKADLVASSLAECAQKILSKAAELHPSAR